MEITSASGVAARIQELRALFASTRAVAPGPSASPTGRTAPVTGFDPFGEAYQAALRSAGVAPAATTPPGGPAVGAPGLTGPSTAVGLGGMPVPVSLQRHGNGRLPAAELTPIGQDNHRLYGPAASTYTAMRDAAAREGIALRITDSYRDYAQQVDLAARKGLFSNGGLAAVPGTSNHGWGMAIDANVNDPRTLAWMRTNAGRFGWVGQIEREPWHWEYRPDLTGTAPGAASTSMPAQP